MELSYNQLSYLLRRYPKFEFSYETVSQKGNLSNYDICLVIPNGKKACIWNTFYSNIDISYLLDLNREKNVCKASIIKKYPIHPMSHNTILYGTILEEEECKVKFFVIEDIYYYRGVFMKNIPYANKLSYIKEYITSMNSIEHNIVFTLPFMWKHTYDAGQELPFAIDANVINKIGYTPHHLQYRSLQQISPYINVILNRKLNISNQVQLKSVSQIPVYRSKYNIDFTKPQYKYNTIFEVKADLQYDIYHLFAYGNKKSQVYYQLMYIPDYKTSVMLNQIFRKIRENDNIDYIEESEDEEDFQNTEVDKYVDLNKIVLFECKFHRKFKKWYPVTLVNKQSRIVHINKLVNNY